MQRNGAQFVSVEDTVCAVHASHGRIKPARRPALRGVDRLPRRGRTLGPARVRWTGLAFADDYDRIRDRISRVVPGCEDYNHRVRQDGRLRPPARPARLPDLPDRERQARDHRQRAGVAASARRAGCSCRPSARTTSSTRRSTASTTATAASRTAVGWSSCNPRTSPSSALADGDDGRPALRVDRRRRPARATSSAWWPTPSRAAARRRTSRRPTRWSPLDHQAEGSGTPVSKAIVVRLVPVPPVAA